MQRDAQARQLGRAAALGQQLGGRALPAVGPVPAAATLGPAAARHAPAPPAVAAGLPRRSTLLLPLRAELLPQPLQPLERLGRKGLADNIRQAGVAAPALDAAAQRLARGGGGARGDAQQLQLRHGRIAARSLLPAVLLLGGFCRALAAAVTAAGPASGSSACLPPCTAAAAACRLPALGGGPAAGCVPPAAAGRVPRLAAAAFAACAVRQPLSQLQKWGLAGRGWAGRRGWPALPKDGSQIDAAHPARARRSWAAPDRWGAAGRPNGWPMAATLRPAAAAAGAAAAAARSTG